MSARVKLPQELAELLRSELETAIKEAALYRDDELIARRYIIEKWPQMDIAAYSREKPAATTPDRGEHGKRAWCRSKPDCPTDGCNTTQIISYYFFFLRKVSLIASSKDMPL